MTGAVLAGGLSSRMGYNKAFIKIDGETIIERTVRLLKDEFDEVLVIANDILLYEGLGVRVAADIFKGAGSLGGIYTALFHSANEYTFVTACDMPYLNIEAVRKVINSVKGFEAAVPLIGDRPHPMHSVYSGKSIKQVGRMIKEGDLMITGLFDRINTRFLKEKNFKGIPIEDSLKNINTKEDLLHSGLSISDR